MVAEGRRKRDGREWEERGGSQLPSGAREAGKKGSLVAGGDGDVVIWRMEGSWAAAEWGAEVVEADWSGGSEGKGGGRSWRQLMVAKQERVETEGGSAVEEKA
ncbi:hypothetical protein AMTR_s00008p00260600 [Amborella trichopoda]|uniref:Uncharacterized protein n=1 Tax=Amborella trichopoda TaxID=13333 RepID=W1NJV3_AMBTC|nr:hypothetical protein AMTR_s00008p00260600 [Amborella trichopoda]